MNYIESNKTNVSKVVRFFALIGIVVFAVPLAYSQGKRVKVLRLEVDGQEVRSDFRVDIISDEKKGKVYKAKTDKTSFSVPAEIVGQNVGIIFRFKKYTATFFFVGAADFDHDWIVGVDTKPFADEFISSSDPPDTEIIYYIKLDGNPKPWLITKVGKPKVTVRRIN